MERRKKGREKILSSPKEKGPYELIFGIDKLDCKKNIILCNKDMKILALQH